LESDLEKMTKERDELKGDLTVEDAIGIGKKLF
jgi:hypothetical protein